MNQYQHADAARTRELLPYPELVREIEVVLRLEEQGVSHAPTRHHLTLPGGGVLLVMPAVDDTIAITKLATVHPANLAKGYPSVQAEVIVMEAQTGRWQMILDGPTVTARRTAAVTAWAIQRLAPVLPGDLLLIGAGVQAHSHLECLAELGLTRKVWVCSRGVLQRQKLVEYGQHLGLEMLMVEEAALVLPKVRIVVSTTSSPTPVVPANVASGTLVAAVGAYTPAMSELPVELMQRATQPGSLLVADSPAACHEVGEFVLAGIVPDQIRLLGDIRHQPATFTDIAVFKSVGQALWDLAAARVALRTVSS
jgi:1-piperideine-2-carboxylate/1-pyrroline-2-carboxylate reductase [NAD(P)H]